jgi:hypothetical protein
MEQETLNRYSCCGMIDGHGEILALTLQFEPFALGIVDERVPRS